MKITKKFANEVIDKGIILGTKNIKDKFFEMDFTYYYYENMFLRLDECETNKRKRINEVKLFDIEDELLVKLIDSKKIIFDKEEKEEILHNLYSFITGEGTKQHKNINLSLDYWIKGNGLTVKSEYENCEMLFKSKKECIMISTEDGLNTINFDDSVGFMYDDSIEDYHALKVCNKIDDRSYNIVTIIAYDNEKYNDYSEDIVNYMNNRLILE